MYFIYTNEWRGKCRSFTRKNLLPSQHGIQSQRRRPCSSDARRRGSAPVTCGGRRSGGVGGARRRELRGHGRCAAERGAVARRGEAQKAPAVAVEEVQELECLPEEEVPVKAASLLGMCALVLE